MIVAEHLCSEVDYTCVDNLSYVVPEVMTAGALRTMARHAVDAHCHEHVTPYFREHTGAFNTLTLPSCWADLRPGIRLTVDTLADLQRMRSLFDRLGRAHRLVSLEQVYHLWDHVGKGATGTVGRRPAVGRGERSPATHGTHSLGGEPPFPTAC
jgi:spore coat polysaccharide biosynthesis protein SpsF (cytidylyltransferase family)